VKNELFVDIVACLLNLQLLYFAFGGGIFGIGLRQSHALLYACGFAGRADKLDLTSLWLDSIKI
jgi:hypothetical protein